MEEFNRACNTLSETAFQQSLHRKYDIHHAGYHLIREETNLPAQHVINAIAKVTNAYTREPNKFHRFKPHSSVRYIALRHDLVAMGHYFCECSPKEVNWPEAVRPSFKRRQVRNLKPQASSTARPRA
jgi:hypothetical protein